MPCYRPLSAWQSPRVDGSTSTISFSGNQDRYFDVAKHILLPCGQCIGCRLERSRRWAVRLMHEAEMHEFNCFITLTYDESHVPKDGSLRVEDFQLFMKRLRRGSSAPLRFFHCGEYGDQKGRPHYHACLFGEDFRADRVRIEDSCSGHPQWISPRLCEAWKHQGRATIGELNFESAAYVARYCVKKITELSEEKKAKFRHEGRKFVDFDEHYQGRRPEYVTMSRRPGIGATWFDKYRTDVYPWDEVIMRGRAMMPPPAYDKLLEKVDPALFERVKRERAKESTAPIDFDELYNGRLDVVERVKNETVKQTLKRKL